MLDKLSPVPGQSELPGQIADFYIKEDQEVAEARKSFDQLYRDALAGDLPSAIAYVAVESAINNNEDDIDAAAEELEETINDIVELVDDAEEDSTEDASNEYSGDDYNDDIY